MNTHLERSYPVHRPLFLLTLFLTALTGVVLGQSAGPPVGTGDSYREQAARLQRENRELEREAQALEAQLAEYCSDWSAEEKGEAEKWFLRSGHNPRKMRRAIGYYEPEYDADRKHWDEMTLSTLQPEFQGSHLRFLEEEKKLLGFRKVRAANRILAYQEYSGNVPWEILSETLALSESQIIPILGETLSSVEREFRQCISDVFTKAIQIAMLDAAHRDLNAVSDPATELSDKMFWCAARLPAKLVVNAFEAALKQHFILDMQEAGVTHPEVIDYWWDHHVMAREKQTILEAAVEKALQSDDWLGEVFEEWVCTGEIPKPVKQLFVKLYNAELASFIRNSGEQGAQSWLTWIAQTADKFYRKVAKDYSLRLMYEGSLAFVRYVERGVTIWCGQDDFKTLVAPEIQKYRYICDCLERCGKPVTGTAILDVFKKSGQEYQRWIREDCWTGPPAPQQERYLDQVLEVINALQALADRADLLAGQGLERCTAARAQLGSARGPLEQAGSAIAALETRLENRRTALAEIPALLISARETADDASRQGQALGTLYGLAGERAERACEAMEMLAAEEDLAGKRNWLDLMEASATTARWKYQELADGIARLEFTVAQAEDAAGDVLALAGEASGPVTADGGIDGLLASAGGYLAASRGLLAEGRELGLEARDLGPMARELLDEGVRKLHPLRKGLEYDQLYDTMVLLVDRVVDAGDRVDGCIEIANDSLRNLEADHLVAMERWRAIQAALASAGGAVSTERWAAEAAAAASDARAALDVADVTDGMARTTVRLAEECRSLGRTLYRAAAGGEPIDLLPDGDPGDKPTGGFEEIGQKDAEAKPERGDFVAIGSDEARATLNDAQRAWVASHVEGRGYTPDKINRMIRDFVGPEIEQMFEQQSMPGYEEDLARALENMAGTLTLITTGHLPGDAGGGGTGGRGAAPRPKPPVGDGPNWGECVRKYCKMCFDDEIVLGGVPNDQECADCIERNQALIAECYGSANGGLD